MHLIGLKMKEPFYWYRNNEEQFVQFSKRESLVYYDFGSGFVNPMSKEYSPDE